MARSERRLFPVLLVSFALVPAALGYVVARWMPAVWQVSPLMWGLAFLAGWFLVGRHLRKKGCGFASLAAGLLPSLLWAAVYIHQFYLTPGPQRDPSLLCLGSQVHSMIAVAPATELLHILGITALDSRVVVLTAYAMMMAAFAAGFISGRSRSR